MKISKPSYLVLTFFFLLSCTQLPPPVSGKAGNGAKSLDSELPASVGTLLSLDDSVSGAMKLVLSGEDAGKVYRLMGIAKESGADAPKVGRDFSCRKDGETQECEFLIRMPEGNFKVQREESGIKKAAPEMAQVKESDAYISIADPSEGGRVRLQVLDVYAERIFKSLNVARTFDLTADQVNGPGVRKAAEQVDCYQRSKASTPEQKTYDCYLFLNTDLGAMAAVDPSVQQ